MVEGQQAARYSVMQVKKNIGKTVKQQFTNTQTVPHNQAHKHVGT